MLYLSSATRVLIGYTVSVMLGLTLGALLAGSTYAKHTLGTLVLGLQSLPSICWLPFALIWLGLNEKAILMVVILGAVFSISVTTENALRNVAPIYGRVGRTLGAKGFTLTKDILVFAALPEIISGLKVGWTFAWRSLMAAELLRPDALGLGHMLEVGRQFNDIPMMLASVFTILAIGLTVDWVGFANVERAVRRRWGIER